MPSIMTERAVEPTRSIAVRPVTSRREMGVFIEIPGIFMKMIPFGYRHCASNDGCIFPGSILFSSMANGKLGLRIAVVSRLEG